MDLRCHTEGLKITSCSFSLHTYHIYPIFVGTFDFVFNDPFKSVVLEMASTVIDQTTYYFNTWGSYKLSGIMYGNAPSFMH